VFAPFLQAAAQDHASPVKMRNELYSLKRRWGAPLAIYKLSSASVDLSTGERTIDKASYDIERAIPLPAQTVRNEIANQIAPRDWWDSAIQVFVIDCADVPDIELNQDDYLIFNGKRFNVESFDAWPHVAAWIIVGRHVIGDVPEQIHNVSADNLLSPEQQAS
jgi:hypothetical protein